MSLATIHFPRSPLAAGAITAPQLGLTYVPLLDPGLALTPFLSIVDTQTGHLLRTVHAGGLIDGLAVDSARHHLFVSLDDATAETLTGVSMLDARSGTVLRTVLEFGSFGVGTGVRLQPPRPGGYPGAATSPLFRPRRPVFPHNRGGKQGPAGPDDSPARAWRATSAPDETHERAFLDNGNGTLRLVDIACLA